MLEHTVSQYYQPIVSQFQYNPYQSLQNVQNGQYSNQDENNKWYAQEDEYDYTNDVVEECSCDDCENLKPSCRNACPNCFPPQNMVDQMASTYMFYQYPYQYYAMPNITANEHQISTTENIISISHNSVLTTSTPIEETTETTEFSTISPESKHTANETKDTTNAPMSMFMRTQNKIPHTFIIQRRTRPNRIPKNMPFSGQFAEKLVLQMRKMKMLHSRRNNF